MLCYDLVNKAEHNKRSVLVDISTIYHIIYSPAVVCSVAVVLLQSGFLQPGLHSLTHTMKYVVRGELHRGQCPACVRTTVGPVFLEILNQKHIQTHCLLLSFHLVVLN